MSDQAHGGSCHTYHLRSSNFGQDDVNISSEPQRQSDAASHDESAAERKKSFNFLTAVDDPVIRGRRHQQHRGQRHQSKAAAWTAFDEPDSCSNARVRITASWKPRSACAPGGTMRASVSSWPIFFDKGILLRPSCSSRPCS
jgi:hypothetical protein